VADVGNAARIEAIEAFARGSRVTVPEWIAWGAMVALAFVLPKYSALYAEIASLALFAVSLDLILGYGGIVSLGHAAFFGLGAYAAALFAKYFMNDPLVGLVVGAAVAAVLGAVTSVLVLRGSDLTRLMMTLGVCLMLGELANKLDWLTGGTDGLQGVVMGPLLGRFDFDLGGRVGYVYCLTVLAILFFLARRLVHAPFGYSLRAMRDNRLRAIGIGIDANKRLAVTYTLSAAFAGIAGALVAQTTGFASLDLFDFHRSADVLLVLVIGGTGYLYGGIIGAIAFKLMYDVLSGITPQYWQFWMGLALVVIVLIGHERLARPFALLSARASGRRARPVPPARGTSE
jgi:branched-chain amino acid transport system permease protein